MELALFADFGSTFTKVTVVDLAEEEICAKGQSGTTPHDIMIGLQSALEDIYSTCGSHPVFKYKMACSSAAGGLKVVAIGLVKSLTCEAAKITSLGAGAKVLDTLANELTDDEIDRINKLCPDIILLAGGTDGGNKKVIVHNATKLTQLSTDIPIIIAGNKAASPMVERILKETGFSTYIVENLMPELNVLNVEPARAMIRTIFLKNIIRAKGLDGTRHFFTDGILMPTPSAVLKAAEILAKGTENEPGLSELMVIDPGGATTDVYSIADGAPTKPGVVFKGLPEQVSKRTVEGDLGMRFSVHSLVAAAKEKSYFSLPEDMRLYVDQISQHPLNLPDNEKDKSTETFLGQLAIEIAINRHCGFLETVYTPFGQSFLQYGKDLTQVAHVVGTGGVLVNHENPLAIMQKTQFQTKEAMTLKPLNPTYWIDKNYIFAAMGLLAEIDSSKAIRIMKKNLRKLGGQQ